MSLKSFFNQNQQIKIFDDFSEIHKVLVPQSLCDKVSLVAVGQKVFVFGKLRVKKFKRDNGTGGSEFEIKARQIYDCGFGDETGPSMSISQTDDVGKKRKLSTMLNNDLNCAEIFSQISFGVINKHKFSCFHLASNYFSLLVIH